MPSAASKDGELGKMHRYGLSASRFDIDGRHGLESVCSKILLLKGSSLSRAGIRGGRCIPICVYVLSEFLSKKLRTQCFSWACFSVTITAATRSSTQPPDSLLYLRNAVVPVLMRMLVPVFINRGLCVATQVTLLAVEYETQLNLYSVLNMFYPKWF